MALKRADCVWFGPKKDRFITIDDDDYEVTMVNRLRDDAFVVCMEGHARPPSHRRRRSLPPPAADHGTPQNPPTPRNTDLHAARTACTMVAMLVVFASRGPEEVAMIAVFAAGT